MKVRCINSSGYLSDLTEGQVYQVKRQHELFGHDYYFLEGVIGGWMTNRFEVVEEDTPTASPSAVKVVATRQEKPCSTCKRLNDVGVNICWNCGNKP